MNYKQLQKSSLEQLNNPSVGDYWHEMYSPVCVVVERLKNHVVICKKTKSVDHEHWTWDLSNLETMTLDDFRKWLCYNSEPLKDKTWALCIKEHHKWVLAGKATIMQKDL